MRRIALATVGVLVALFVASQLLVPPYVEHRVASRLTADGGHAQVQVSAFPAFTLLTGSGDRLRVRAQGINLSLAIPVAGQTGPRLDRLDKFGTVDIRVTGANAGPFKLSSLSVTRAGGAHDYTVALDATTTAADLATYTGGQIAGDLGGLFGSFAGSALPFADQPVPINVNSTVHSDGGAPVVVSADGAIAGIPINPLIQALSAALAGRI
jgi:hypothetical protein